MNVITSGAVEVIPEEEMRAKVEHSVSSEEAARRQAGRRPDQARTSTSATPSP